MEVSLRFFIFLLTVAACVSLLSADGNEGRRVRNTCLSTTANRTAPRGGSVTITCRYQTERRRSRYFCKEDLDSACSPLIQTSQAALTRKDRFTLREDQQRGVYNVTISSLTMNDTGRYRCVMGGSGQTCLAQVNLLILNWSDIEPTETISETSNTAKIKCSYPDDHQSNEKFLCKGEDPFHCEVLINATEGNQSVSNGRFSIRDNRRRMHFHVNIVNVSRGDSGTYWCGSDRRWQHDKFNKTLLTVVKKGGKSDAATEENAIQVRDLSTDKVAGVISPVAAFLSMLLTLVVVLLLARRKLLRIRGGSSEQRTDVGQNTEGNHEDREYEEIEMQNQQENQQENSGRTLLSVYSTVGPPSDQIHYASVAIRKDPAGHSTLPGTLNNDWSACEYSSISRTQSSTLPPPAESDFL